MSTPEKPANGGLQAAIKKRRERRERWQREGEPTIGENLGMIGALGWAIVIPTVLGVLAGHWLDKWMQSGVVCTACLLIIGLVLGCILAWKRIQKP